MRPAQILANSARSQQLSVFLYSSSADVHERSSGAIARSCPGSPMKCCPKEFSRRTVSIGLASLLVNNTSMLAQGSVPAGGCAFLQAGCSFAERGATSFPELAPITDNAAMAIEVSFGVELTMLLQISASPGFYDDGDSGPRGNACASFKPLFPIVQGARPVDGGVAFGRKCYAGLAGSSAGRPVRGSYMRVRWIISFDRKLYKSSCTI